MKTDLRKLVCDAYRKVCAERSKQPKGWKPWREHWQTAFCTGETAECKIPPTVWELLNVGFEAIAERARKLKQLKARPDSDTQLVLLAADAMRSYKRGNRHMWGSMPMRRKDRGPDPDKGENPDARELTIIPQQHTVSQLRHEAALDLAWKRLPVEARRLIDDVRGAAASRQGKDATASDYFTASQINDYVRGKSKAAQERLRVEIESAQTIFGTLYKEALAELRERVRLGELTADMCVPARMDSNMTLLARTRGSPKRDRIFRRARRNSMFLFELDESTPWPAILPRTDRPEYAEPLLPVRSLLDTVRPF